MSTCRVEDGGEPRCGLATAGCGTVELRGNSLRPIIDSIHAGENVADPLLTVKAKDFDILFIGEAPGAKEDTRGLPFQGTAGEKLAELVAAAGLPIDRVFVTNIVKCRPPANRKPHT